MNVSLTPELEKFVTEKVKSGKYSSAEEVIREGLRLLKEHEENGQHQRAEKPQRSSVRIVEPVTAEKEWQWLREHQEEYRGQWVALEGDRLVSHGMDAEEVFLSARKAGVKVPALVHVPSEPELPWGGW